jgi:hypothetical protein
MNSLHYECPPATIRKILTFSTKNRQACQMMHLRQNSTPFVGIGGYDSSEYASFCFVVFSILFNDLMT